MRPENGTHRMHFHGALSGLVREDEFHGRDHLVAPVVMVREMVLDQGTHGELLPGEEIERSAELRLWEGRPVTIGHPEEHFSAGELEASEQAEVGRLRNVEAVENGTVKLKGEAWIDVEQAERLPDGEEILETLRDYTQSDVPDSARPLEVSTGYLAQFEREGGVLGNERYAGIQRAIIPDHLALLPNGVGKCSREDGCGMPRLNAAGHSVYTATIDLKHAQLRPPTSTYGGTLQTNVLSSARTPDFSDTSGGEVPEGWPPSLSDFIDANDWDAEQWDDLTDEQQQEVVATTLLGEVEDTFEASMVFPVVDEDGALQENALVAVLGGRGAQADVPEDALTSARGVARTLLEEEFDRDLDDEETQENAAPSPAGTGGYLRRALSSVADRLDQDEIGRRVLEALGVTDEEDPVDPETNQIELPEDFSLDELRDALDDAVEAEHGGSDVFTWIVDVFEEDFVFTVDPQGEEETFFRADYAVEDGVVEIGEQTEVERQVEFVPVDNGAGVELEVDYEPAAAEDDAGADEDRFQIENGKVRVADGCECGGSEERTPAPAGA